MLEDIKKIIREKPIKQLTKELKEAGVKFISYARCNNIKDWEDKINELQNTKKEIINSNMTGIVPKIMHINNEIVYCNNEIKKLEED